MFKNFNKIFHTTQFSTLYKHNNLVLKKTRNIDDIINNETNILNTLNHQNIPKIHLNQTTYEPQYLVMDYYSRGYLYDNCKKKI
tara:strand:- start:418 stop:669 length:252 start_codon:yes stop_codon:yes gene_type:complete